MKLKSLLLETDDTFAMDFQRLKNAYDIAHYLKNKSQDQKHVHKYEQYLSVIGQALNNAALRNANQSPRYNRDPISSTSIKNPDAKTSALGAQQ